LLLLPAALQQVYRLHDTILKHGLRVSSKVVTAYFKQLPCNVQLAVFVDGQQQGELVGCSFQSTAPLGMAACSIVVSGLLLQCLIEL
jgi:hypothetical protein